MQLRRAITRSRTAIVKPSCSSQMELSGATQRLAIQSGRVSQAGRHGGVHALARAVSDCYPAMRSPGEVLSRRGEFQQPGGWLRMSTRIQASTTIWRRALALRQRGMDRATLESGGSLGRPRLRRGPTTAPLYAKHPWRSRSKGPFRKGHIRPTGPVALDGGSVPFLRARGMPNFRVVWKTGARTTPDHDHGNIGATGRNL